MVEARPAAAQDRRDPRHLRRARERRHRLRAAGPPGAAARAGRRHELPAAHQRQRRRDRRIVDGERRLYETRAVGAEHHARPSTASSSQQRQQELSRDARAQVLGRAQPRAEPAGTGQDHARCWPAARSRKSTSCAWNATSARSRGESEQAGAQIARVQAAIGEAQRKIQETELTFRNEARKELAEVMGKLNALNEGAVALSRQGRQVADQEPGARPRAAPARQHRRRRDAAGQGHRRDRAARRRAGARGARCSPRTSPSSTPGQAATVKFTRLRFLDLRRPGRRGREHQPRHRGRRTRQRLLPGAGAHHAAPTSAKRCPSSRA